MTNEIKESERSILESLDDLNAIMAQDETEQGSSGKDDNTRGVNDGR